MEELKHLAFAREPDFEGKRKARRPPPPPPVIVNRESHAKKLQTQTRSSLETLRERRAKLGLGADRHLVLEVSTWDTRIRDAFQQRFDARVVEECPVQTQLIVLLVEGTSGDVQDGILAGRMPQVSDSGDARIRRAVAGDFGKAAEGEKPQLPPGRQPEDFSVVELPSTAPDREAVGAKAAEFPVLWSGTSKATAATVVVQFDQAAGLSRFQSEMAEYRRGTTDATAMPAKGRAAFFDAIEWCRARGPSEREGPLLKREGFPSDLLGHCEFDVDLWHPGDPQSAHAVRKELRQLCVAHGGSCLDDAHTSSMILARVSVPKKAMAALLDWDQVARVELPPRLLPGYEILHQVRKPPKVTPPPPSPPALAVIDSGTIAAHPYLRGWILDERDFGTSEPDATDHNGHGTRVTGLAVYGSLVPALQSGTWSPSVAVYSGKVLQHDPHTSETVFPKGKRPEKLIEEAISYFSREYGCRVFNLSVGFRDDLYSFGRRQFPLAEKLDQLARELDVVIVVPTGNFWPTVPDQSPTRDEWQRALRDQRLADLDARLINPATAALAITVGAIARSAEPKVKEFIPAAPENSPAPFSRVGPGYDAMSAKGGVKPDFVSYGGNLGLRVMGGLRWHDQEPFLGEPTTIPETSGRLLGSCVGTSFAAPQVAHAAAKAEVILRDSLEKAPSANAIRALLGACSEAPDCSSEWLLDPKGQESADKLRLVGHGLISGERLARSVQNDVCLVAEGTLLMDKWHIYSLPLPQSFLDNKGERGLVVSLAYNPPVRATRKEYLARTLSLGIYRDVSLDHLRRQIAKAKKGDAGLDLSGLGELKARPPRTDLTWSTLQVQRILWKKKLSSFKCSEGDSSPTLRLVVTCHERFQTGESALQDYALCVRVWHRDQEVKLYQHLRSQVRARQHVRAGQRF